AIEQRSSLASHDRRIQEFPTHGRLSSPWVSRCSRPECCCTARLVPGEPRRSFVCAWVFASCLFRRTRPPSRCLGLRRGWYVGPKAHFFTDRRYLRRCPGQVALG